MLSPIRIAIFDQNPILRRGLKEILSAEKGFEIVFDVSCHIELIDRLNVDEIDIILLGHNELLPAELKHLAGNLQIRPSTKIIALIDCSDHQQLSKATKMGVKGVQCTQDFVAEEFINITRTVHLGGKSLSTNCVMTLIGGMDSDNGKIQPQTHQPVVSLSSREQQVLDLLSKGKSNNDIAENLFISARTVKFHVSSILSKLNVKNQTVAALTAI